MSQICKTVLTGSLSVLFILQGVAARSKALHRTSDVGNICHQCHPNTLSGLDISTFELLHFGTGRGAGRSTNGPALCKVYKEHIPLVVARVENVYSSVLAGFLSVSNARM